jgi:hypothetical protein
LAFSSLSACSANASSHCGHARHAASQNPFPGIGAFSVFRLASSSSWLNMCVKWVCKCRGFTYRCVSDFCLASSYTHIDFGLGLSLYIYIKMYICIRICVYMPHILDTIKACVTHT